MCTCVGPGARRLLATQTCTEPRAFRCTQYYVLCAHYNDSEYFSRAFVRRRPTGLRAQRLRIL